DIISYNASVKTLYVIFVDMANQQIQVCVHIIVISEKFNDSPLDYRFISRRKGKETSDRELRVIIRKFRSRNNKQSRFQSPCIIPQWRQTTFPFSRIKVP